VDATAALLVRDPARFDCIVTGNMFGDILSDEASEISGGLGIAGSIMAGDELCVAQAQHGSAPDIAGQDKANPTSLILSLAMLLAWLGERHRRPDLAEAARAIEAAVDRSLQDRATRTADLGGTLGTRAFARHVAGQLA
jgi:3-isopropylmalate dehydrogenase